MIKIGTSLRQERSRLMPLDDGWSSTITVVKISGDRVAVDFNGTRQKWFWKLPDDTLSLISTEPKKRYRRTVDGFKFWPNGRFTVAGKFPDFTIAETGQRVWLDYDRSLKLEPVNFVERCDEHFAILRSYKTNPVKRIRPKNADRIVTEKLRLNGAAATRWSVWRNGECLESSIVRGDDARDARREARRWLARASTRFSQPREVLTADSPLKPKVMVAISAVLIEAAPRRLRQTTIQVSVAHGLRDLVPNTLRWMERLRLIDRAAGGGWGFADWSKGQPRQVNPVVTAYVQKMLDGQQYLALGQNPTNGASADDTR